MIPDFDDAEIKIIDDTLKERYGVAKETERCDVEMRIRADDYETIDSPSVYWEHNGCHSLHSCRQARKSRCRYRRSRDRALSRNAR